MKKILSILGAITLSATSVGAVVSCGLKPQDWHTITVGIVNNGSDKNERPAMEKAKAKFDEIYGNLGYKISFVEYIDENEVPKRIQGMGNTQEIPDVFAPTVDMTNQLSTAGVLLPLEGKLSPWGVDQASEDPDNPVGASILKNLHYNFTKEDKTKAQDLLDEMNKRIKEGASMEGIDQKDEWNTFLPYAIEASKFQSRNARNSDEKPVQYGITKHVGVGGGSAIINNEKGKFDQMFIDLGLVDPDEPRIGEDKTEFNWIENAQVSIEKLVKYMIDPEEGMNAAKQIFTLVDRGMWWMYPVYANAIPKALSAEKREALSAAKIGVNWLNDAFADQGIKDNRGIKYSSIFGNQNYTESTTEIVEKWFQLFGAMVINAQYNLDNADDNPIKHGRPLTSEWDYNNLFDVDQNRIVQENLVNHSWAAGVNYEPGSYFDMLKGFSFFQNMDYAALGKIEIFDHETEKSTADIYKEAGLNTWLTPAGSGQVVFNKNLVGANDPEMTKAEAAMRFVETTFGFYKDHPDGEEDTDETNPIIGHGDGGIRNLTDQFASAGDNPVQLAILDHRNQETEEFAKSMDKKVDTKFNRAATEYAETWLKEVKADPKKEQQERDAILRLETTSISLAANLYRQGGDGLSLAPNKSAFDEAGPLDYHGKTAMQVALAHTLGDKRDAGVPNPKEWNWTILKEQAKKFAKLLMQKLAKQDEDKSNIES